MQAGEEEEVVITFERRLGKRVRSAAAAGSWHHHRAKRSDWSAPSANQKRDRPPVLTVILERFDYMKTPGNETQQVSSLRSQISKVNIQASRFFLLFHKLTVRMRQ